MTTLELQYRRSRDSLIASIEGIRSIETVEVRRDRVTLQIDRSRNQLVSFEVADFSHFVSYHLLGQLLGDEAIKKLAAFQSAIAASPKDTRKRVTFAGPPASGQRVVAELLRAA